jgi:hypothetical protein
MKVRTPVFIVFDPAQAIAEALRDNPHRVRVLLRGGRPCTSTSCRRTRFPSR